MEGIDVLAYIPKRGAYYPVVVCDACKEQITSNSGNAYWIVGAKGKTWNDVEPIVLHTHKGRCAQIDRVIEARTGGTVMSEELDVWLKQLHHNTRVRTPIRRRRS